LQEIQLAKHIALSIEHIKISRREKNEEYSDKEIVAVLNRVGATIEGWVTIKPHRFDGFRYGGDRGSIPEHKMILSALDALMHRENIRISFAELERRHGHRLPPILRQSTSNVFQGEVLGSTANALHGAWQFFYLSPFNRERRSAPQFRGIGVFIPQPNPNARTADFFVLSGHGRWEGDAFVNNTHVYMMCSDTGKSEGAFFLTSKPKDDVPFLAGLGTALEREIARPTRPALGFVCFGQKWSPDSLQRDASDEFESTVRRAITREDLAQHEVEVLRQHFCRPYTESALRRSFPELFAYLSKLRLNKKPEMASRWLYLEWPN
jgi:hypothetical protein